jgi:membrane-bound lytic murein transglycosylase F
MIHFLRRNRMMRTGALVAAGAALALQGAGEAAGAGEPPGVLPALLDSGQITMITIRSPHSYYVYRGRPMGFEYELARAFADHLGLRLHVLALNDWDEMTAALAAGRGHFIAAGIEITPERARQVAFSRAYQTVRPQLIAHRRLAVVESPQELAGKTVHVARGSAPHELLRELKAQGVDVTIRDHERASADQLIQRVARAEIDYTVAQSNVALLSRRYYPNAVVQTALHGSLLLGWAVDPAAADLRATIDDFFLKAAESGRLNDIYEKYHWNIGDFDYLALSTFHERLKTRLPRFRPLFQEAAGKNGFDWRLVAAQAYRESHFDPSARGPNGALGIMQINPETARRLKIAAPLDPAANIRGGTGYLKYLYDLYDQAGEEDRVLLALAAYNCGPGHLQDARRLAEKKGLDPNRWDSLAATLPLLRLRQHYRRAEHGFCRGDITVAYVRHVLTYYDILKRQEIDTLLAAAEPDAGRRSYRSN